MLKIIGIFITFLTFSHTAAAQNTGESGAPIPRFVSISASEANMRTGPGRQYPIDWMYKRPGLPMEVVAENGSWRQVKDQDGTTGWMHVSLLSSRRMATIKGRTRKLYKDRDLTSHVVMTADAGVIGEVLSCSGIWCELEIDGLDGWIERRNIHGIYPREELD